MRTVQEWLSRSDQRFLYPEHFDFDFYILKILKSPSNDTTTKTERTSGKKVALNKQKMRAHLQRLQRIQMGCGLFLKGLYFSLCGPFPVFGSSLVSFKTLYSTSVQKKFSSWLMCLWYFPGRTTNKSDCSTLVSNCTVVSRVS